MQLVPNPCFLRPKWLIIYYLLVEIKEKPVFEMRPKCQNNSSGYVYMLQCSSTIRKLMFYNFGIYLFTILGFIFLQFWDLVFTFFNKSLLYL